MRLFTVSPRARVLLRLLCLAGLPCLAGAGTVVQSVADCSLVGGFGHWSDPAIWSLMQVPNNGKPAGTTYDVVVPTGNCAGIFLDVSVTVNRVSMAPLGFWDGAKEKGSKIKADGVSLTIWNDARIDELGMTNGKLDIGGTAWPGVSDGWLLADSKVKAGNYRQEGFALAWFVRSAIQIADTFRVAEFAFAELERSTLETQKLELLGVLSLRDAVTVNVKGDFEQRHDLWGGVLGIQLDGRTDFSVDGDVFLDGTLSGSLSDGFVPSVGEEFTVLRYKGSLTGNWTDISLPQLPADRAWSLVFGKQAVSLKVVPTT